jgi:hypothetical protein
MAKKSVLIEDLETCCVCGSPHVQLHHVLYGVGNRQIADRYGYIVPLCLEHHTGNGGVHFNNEMDLHFKQMAQEHFETHHGSREDFIKIFGRSYL